MDVFEVNMQPDSAVLLFLQELCHETRGVVHEETKDQEGGTSYEAPANPLRAPKHREW